MLKKSCFVVFLLIFIAMVSFALADDVILADNEYVSVTLKGFEEDPFWGFTMKLLVENKTDKTVMFSINDCAVNGVMNDPFWATEIMPGSKSNEKVSWINLEEQATQIDFELKAYDSNDWLADPFVKENHVVYPYGAENARITERAAATGDVVLFDNDKAAMILTKFYEDEIWGYSVDAYLVNKTDKNLMFSVDGATVNGFICDPFWACEVKGGMRAYSTISWMESSFEENDIDQVEKIMLSVGVSDAEDWMADAIVKEQFTLVP